jgi:hypothetical protein
LAIYRVAIWAVAALVVISIGWCRLAIVDLDAAAKPDCWCRRPVSHKPIIDPLYGRLDGSTLAQIAKVQSE